MKCIYSTLRPAIEQRSYADWIANCSQILSVSIKGLVAFTSSFCLNQSRPQAVSYHVYVADLNKPYQPYLLVESEHEFTILEWDHSGTKLLTCDMDGLATIYTSIDFLISDWKPHFKQQFAAETFISACWYHPGIISSINVANQNLKTSSNHLEYTDKIQQSKFGASLRLFGGKAAEGCLLISQSGLVCCLTLLADGSVDVVSESLNPLRVRLHVADVSYHKEGSFIIGTSSGSINSTISFYKVTLAVKNLTLDDVDAFSSSTGGTGGSSKRVQVACKQFHSFHINLMSQILNERENTTCAFERVSHIKFVSKDSPTDVLIEVSGQNLSLIELWELETKKRSPIHSAITALKGASSQQKLQSMGSVSIKLEDGGFRNINTNLNMNNGQQQQSNKQSDTNADNNNSLQQQLQTKEWSFKGNYITDKDLIAIHVPRFSIFGANRQLNIILLAYQDNSVCCLRKDDLQPLGDVLELTIDVPRLKAFSNACGGGGSSSRADLDGKLYNKTYSGNSQSRNMTQANGGNHQFSTMNGGSSHHHNSGGSRTPHRHSRQRTNCITDLQLSANQTLFVAIDSMSQLHAVQMPPLISCQDSKDEETYLQYLLEYCLVTGNDWWDVMMCAKRHSIETICDKFYDAYERQPKDIQRKYFNRQLMIRASLYRCLNDAASLCKSSDCHTMIMLNSIGSTLKSMLRSQDQISPSDQLASFLKSNGAQPTFYNANNVLSKINEKEFYVEAQLIQCLQPLNQWIADLAIYLVASLPQRVKSQLSKTQQLPGAGLIKNKGALETLRELLIIIKIWGKQNIAGLPIVYRLNEQIDVIGTLFRLISIHYSTMNNSGEPDEFMLDECTQLTNSITMTQFDYFLPATGVASPSQHDSSSDGSGRRGLGADNSDSRIVMEYFQEYQAAELVQLDKVEGSIDMNGSRKIDVVRNISLGAHPLTNVRHCTRCRAVSLMRPAFNTTRVWEQRWMNTCVCGGHWVQSNGMFSNKKNSLAILYSATNFSSSSGSTTNQLASQLSR